MIGVSIPSLRKVAQVSRHVSGVTPNVSAAALDLCYTACGRLDAFWEIELEPWDMAAGALIVQEAGGQLTNLTGNPNWFPGKSIVASNGIIHQELLDCLST